VDPLRYIPQFVAAGADLITFHIESQSDPYETIRAIRKGGVQAGIVLKPNTPYTEALPFLSLVDVVLVMTVEPGFGGQAFMEDMMEKVRALRAYADAHHLEVRIEVDGGINEKTVHTAVSAGADLLVVGSYLFRQPSLSQGVETLKRAALSCVPEIQQDAE
jgi:ribulose-phosphate 3-epimerase